MGLEFGEKTNNRIFCLDLQTGKLLWEHVPHKLSDAHFEWYEQGVVVYPNDNVRNRSKPLFLNDNTGKLAKAFSRDPKKLHARSATFWNPEIRLDNGWRLDGSSLGFNKTLVFRDTRDRETWRIQTDRIPEHVRSWKDFVFYALFPSKDKAVLYAYRAGAENPTWTLELNRVVMGGSRPLSRMIFHIIEGKLYLEANEHIFCVRPESGMLIWRRNLARDLNLRFYRDFYGGNINLAVFAKSGDVLVISFERRVVALNLKTGKYLWHLQPDTFPHCPFPVAHDNRVILTAGSRRTLTRLPKDDRTATRKAITDKP